MHIDLANLPLDPVLLQRLVRDMAAGMERRDSEIGRLHLIIQQLQRYRFGRRSERVDADQLGLGLEDLEADIARIEEAHSRPVLQDEGNTTEKPAKGRALPDHLARTDIVQEIETRVCPGCGGGLHEAGETISEMLDWAPAQLRVIRIRRPKYGCRSCGTIHQAPAPERVIAKGLATPALLAQVLVSKYCDHTPLYRQSQIFARQGVDLGRSTLAGWIGGACWWLEALTDRLAGHVLASRKLFADDTPVPVLDPGRGRTKTGRLWVYVRDDRPWQGADPPAALYVYSPDRKGERPRTHLDRFRGILQVDGYAGFERLAENGNVTLAACWSHARRKFYDLFESTAAPIAGQALERIGALYKIEAEIKGQSAGQRQSVRNIRSRPLVDAMKLWLEAELERIPGRGRLAEAIRYALSRWQALSVFLDDGRIELDTNAVERAIRPIALGRKNHLFAGSDSGGSRWATVCSLIETAKLNGIEPYNYLSDVLSRMAAGHSAHRLDELLPWNWAPSTVDS